MEKLATGIDGLDEIAGGGLPRSRITLIAGGAGCGKTLFMVTAIARGVLAKGLPAVFFSFEERPEDIIENAAAIGLDLEPFIESGKFQIEFIKRPAETVAEAGRYTLDGLMLRIDLALKRTGAQVLAIDTIETLFEMFESERTVRQELVRVFGWLKGRGVTTLISGEQGDGRLTRHGLEEYVSDCVVLLDQRTVADVTTRRLRIIKYRGAQHGTSEYPFLIDSDGITVMPLSSALLDHAASTTDVTTGLDRLDTALSGGYRQGSTVLITGSSGTGKTIMAANFIAAACRRGEQAAVLSFEESPDEYLANIKAAGIDLRDESASGRLALQSSRPTVMGLEQHLVEVHRLLERTRPRVVVIDQLNSLTAAGTSSEVHRTVVRLIDHLKRNQVTAVFIMEEQARASDLHGLRISSIVDSWLFLEWLRPAGAFQRRLSVIKKRGSGHQRAYLPFEIGADGIKFESEIDA